MSNSVMVSVIIPVYNVEQYLDECIQSVLLQTYHNWELLLVDDGSKDSSGIICDKYAEKDIRIQVIHQENGGLSIARNMGFNKAKGKYVYFLDSDDWILPETLSELVKKAEVEQSEVVFFDAYSFLDEDKEKAIPQNYIRKNAYETQDGFTILEKLLKNKEYHSAVPLMLISRSFLDENCLRFLPHVIYEDMLFTYQLYCKAKRVSYIQNAYYQRRYREFSIMTSKKTINHFRSAKQICMELISFSEEEALLDKCATIDYVARCAMNVLNNYKKLDNQGKRVCKMEEKIFRDYILEKKAFGHKALLMRCYGFVPWVIYKLYEKCIKCLKGNYER